jgi:hypothetical protein
MLQSSFVTQTTAATSAAAPVHNTMDLIATIKHRHTKCAHTRTHGQTDTNTQRTHAQSPNLCGRLVELFQ